MPVTLVALSMLGPVAVLSAEASPTGTVPPGTSPTFSVRQVQVASTSPLARDKARALARDRATAPAPTIPGCDPQATVGTYQNGRLPDTALCDLPGEPGHRLRGDAAVAFLQLRQAYEKGVGKPLCLTDSYRSYGAQVVLKRQKPWLASTPGFSEHGWGLAVDLACGVESFVSTQYAWMAANAPTYGWVKPDWAGPAGFKPEPWHWEYLPGELSSTQSR